MYGMYVMVYAMVNWVHWYMVWYGMVWSREEKKEKEKAQRKQNYTIKEKITHDT